MDWGAFPEKDEDCYDHDVGDLGGGAAEEAAERSRSSWRSASGIRTCRVTPRRSGSISIPRTASW